MRPDIPNLSIITVNLNNSLGLRKTIESVVNQTYPDYEYIIIDGASTDSSIEVIKEYADKLVFWVSESDKGIYNAMNKGIQKAKGKYCLFLNSGDWLVNNVLEKIASQLNKDIDILYGNIYIVDNNDTIYEKIFPNILRFSYLFEQYLPHPASFIKTSLLKKMGGYNETYKICSDWEFYIKAIALQNCSSQNIPVFLSYFPATGISSINYDVITKPERQIIIRELLPLFQKDYEDLQLFKSNYNKNIVRWATNISNNKYAILFNYYFKKVFK